MRTKVTTEKKFGILKSIRILSRPKRYLGVIPEVEVLIEGHPPQIGFMGTDMLRLSERYIGQTVYIANSTRSFLWKKLDGHTLIVVHPQHYKTLLFCLILTSALGIGLSALLYWLKLDRSGAMYFSLSLSLLLTMHSAKYSISVFKAMR